MISLTLLEEVVPAVNLSVEGRSKLEGLIKEPPTDGFVILLEGHPVIETFESGSSLPFVILSAQDMSALDGLRPYDSGITLQASGSGVTAVPMYIIANDEAKLTQVQPTQEEVCGFDAEEVWGSEVVHQDEPYCSTMMRLLLPSGRVVHLRSEYRRDFEMVYGENQPVPDKVVFIKNVVYCPIDLELAKHPPITIAMLEALVGVEKARQNPTDLERLLNVIEGAYGIRRVTIGSESSLGDFPAVEGALSRVSQALGFPVEDGDNLYGLARRMALVHDSSPAQGEPAEVEYVDTSAYEAF
jgi:hypothetical protein